MKQFIHRCLVVIWVVGGSRCQSPVAEGYNSNESQALEFLKEFEAGEVKVYNAMEVASWAARTNITEENKNVLIKAKSKMAEYEQGMRKRALEFKQSAMSYDTARQLNKIKYIGVNAMEDKAKLEQLIKIKADMESIYGKAKVLIDGKSMPLEPDLTRQMAESRNYTRLLEIWKAWRDVCGRLMRDYYTKYVQLSNEAVRSLGFKDYGEEWRASYETPTFEKDVRALFEQVRPLYEQLHAYVRSQLRQKYGEDKFPSTGHIPAHLLGNMWAQSWHNINNEVVPFPEKFTLDVTKEMIKQNYTIRKMFETAEDFFVSLGLEKMLDTFWERSMLEKPRDGREVVCHPSAEDFRNKTDFRIKMCTNINQEHLMTAHHEMGHIEYFMQYRNQPIVYRDGANNGFHEAIGDVMALSVQTPEHLRKIGLLQEDKEADLNVLMSMALQKVAFLPFGYLTDQWRWSVFRGTTSSDEYNKDWWDLRCRYQGVSAPVLRSEDDFDPGAKYHVAADVPYIRYFVSFIIQFQFYKAACDASGYKGHLHRCDIYKSVQAGEKFKAMLSLGASRPWPDAMEIMTGQRKMDAGPLLQYFQPLQDFLREKNGDDVGWHALCPNENEMTSKPHKVANTPDSTKK